MSSARAVRELTTGFYFPLDGERKLRSFRETVAQNTGRARRQWELSQISQIVDEMGPLTLRDGAVFQIPRDGEVPPGLPPGTLPQHPPLGPSDSSSESERESGMDRSTGEGQTPERPGEDSDPPSPQSVRTESQQDREAGDEKFPMARDAPGTITVNEEDFEGAIRFRLEGQPAARVTFPVGEPRRRADHHFCVLDWLGLPPTHTFIRTENVDPPSVASKAAGGEIAPNRIFRMVGADGQLGYPLVSTDFQRNCGARYPMEWEARLENGGPPGTPGE